MIRATLTDGREVVVVFRHRQYFVSGEFAPEVKYPDFEPIAGTNNAWERGTTECFILSGPKDSAVLEGHGITHCSQHDQFNKETGRQIALWRAVTALSKADRGIVVAAYFNRKRGATKPKVKQSEQWLSNSDTY